MKRILKSLLSVFLAFSICTSIYSPVLATNDSVQVQTNPSRDDAPEEVKALVSKLISFYGKGYRPDIIKHLEYLKETSLEYYEIWNSIINYWDWIESDMVENIGVAPDGIINTNKHAFIVLGFALNSDGTMTDELIGRLEVAKASADKYPDSYVLVTGGVEKNGWTEGKRMRDWLVENGIAENRIIVEEKAPDTAGNATNSFEMLYNDYDVDTVSLISTQYHIKRGSILYYTESLLKAMELGVKPITFIGEANAGWYREDKTTESLSLKASSLSTVARVPLVSVSDIKTEMQGIKVSGKTEYVQGDSLDLTVTSIDSLNYNVDLTDFVTVSGFDTNNIGENTVKVTYVQDDEAYEDSFTINISQTPDDLIDRERLGSLISANETRDFSKYTRKTTEYFLAKLAEAKTVYENETATQNEITAAYKKLNLAATKLKELINVAQNKDVQANYNQKDAHKITDNIINTGNYWASMDGNANAPIDQSNFIIDLNGEFSLDTIKIFPYWGGSRYYQYDVYLSDDKVTWDKVVEHRGEEYCTDKGNIHKLENITNARYVKVQGIKTYVSNRPDINNFHVIEAQVFGEEINVELNQALEELQTLYDDYTKKYLEGEYTKDSWAAYQVAMDNVKEILLNGNSSLEEIALAKKALEDAAAKLVSDKFALQIAVDEANKITDQELEAIIPMVVKEFKDALKEAKEILSNPAATQSVVNKSFDRLAKVMQYLEFKKGDKTELNKLIAKIDKLKSDKYLANTWNAMNEVLLKAKEVVINENALETEVQEIHDKLVRAFLQLRLKPNKDLLNELIQKVNGLNKDKYTQASWNALNIALNDAKAVFDNSEASEKEVTVATNNLKAAFDKLAVKDTNLANDDQSGAVKTGDSTSFIGVIGLGASLSILVYLNKKKNGHLKIN